MLLLEHNRYGQRVRFSFGQLDMQHGMRGRLWSDMRRR